MVSHEHSSHRLPVAPNTLQRQFTVAQPNRVWAGDITCVWTLEGWQYLAVLLDLYSRAVVGWTIGSRLTGDLPMQALRMALTTRQPEAGLLHHSDRGSQYAAGPYQQMLTTHGINRQHEPHRQLLGQRLCGELLRNAEARARVPSAVRDAEGSNTGHLRCISRFSITGNAITRPSAITPPLSTNPGWLSRNQVSTK